MRKSNIKQFFWKGFFALTILIIGFILNILENKKEFLGFNSLGDWLIYIGLVALAGIIIRQIFNSRKKRIVDERMEFLAFKSLRITFLAVIISLFVIMVIDGLNPITIPYSLFMSYLVMGIILMYYLTYKIIEVSSNH